MKQLRHVAAFALAAFALSLSAQAQYTVTGAGGDIPDNGGNNGGGAWPSALPASEFLSSDITLPADATSIESIGFTNFNHTWVGDVQLVLVDPAGTGHMLLNRVNVGNTSNFGQNCDLAGNYSIVDAGLAWPATSDDSCDGAGGTTMPTGAYSQFFGAGASQWVQGNDNIFDTAVSCIPVFPGGIYTLIAIDWAGGDPGSFDGWSISGASGAAGPATCSQSLDSTVVAGNGVACSNGGIDLGNQYLRRYDTNSDCGTGASRVVGVSFGVETAVGDPVTGLQQVRVRAYSIPTGADFLYANMTVEAEVMVDVPDGDLQTLVANFAAPAIILPGSDLVLEVATLNDGTEGNVYFPGANDLGQTGASYIASAPCGINDPTDYAAIGFPSAALVLDALFTDLTVGAPVCTSVPNSTGAAASISAYGSAVLADNDLTVTCGDLPTNTFVFIIASTTNEVSSNPAGAGDLCLGGDIGRGVGGVIGNTGAAGEFTVSADLTAMPQPGGPVTAACGETWYIQGWFRDSDGSGGATSGLTDAIGFTVL